MNRLRRREVLFVLIFLGLVATYTILYKLGMTYLDGRGTSWGAALGIVIESLTSTGYGSESPWGHWAMWVFVSVIQLTGIVAIFAAVPLFIIPLFERAFQNRAPRDIEGLTDHVVVCEHTAHGATLISELEQRDVPYVIVESDPEEANALHSDGLSVVYGDPETTSTMESVNVSDAIAVMADGTDEENASIVLAAREVDPDVPIVSLVEHDENADYHRYAGADNVISPEQILGESLSSKISTTVTHRFEEFEAELGAHADDPPRYASAPDAFEVAELSIHRGSALCDRRLADSRIREETGANVIGVWDSGEFKASPDPGLQLSENMVLLAAGTPEQLRGLAELAHAKKRRHPAGKVVILGLGEVGSSVLDELASEDIDATVVDREDAPGVDVVGDATEEWTLRKANVADAETIVFALPDDTTTLFALLVVRELNPDAELIARANEAASVPKMYQAGADYVLALTTISGRMLATVVLDEDVISLETKVGLVRTPVPELAGERLKDADALSDAQVTIVGVERDGRVLASLEPDFEFKAGDLVVVAGNDADINTFQALVNPDGDW